MKRLLLALALLAGCGRPRAMQYAAPCTPSAQEFTAATEAWRWQMPATAKPLLLTALGDAFVELPDGSVHFLDTEAGRFERVARTKFEWRLMLDREPYVSHWFRPDFVARLRQKHGPLQAPNVYAPTQPLILNGALTTDNYTPHRWDAHLHTMGRIHKRVKDLPDGTVITKVD
jgi:hypothetical protein